MTLFGVVDAAYTYGKSDVNNKTSMSNGAQSSSRLGFKGEEDLGGGLKAAFHLEAALRNDSGSTDNTSTDNQTAAASTSQGLTFNRRSTLSLMGNFGEVRLGRDYVPTFWSHTAYDPFGTVGVGASQANAFNAGPVTGVRASNSIGYLSPSFNGVALWAQTYMGENKSDAAVGKKTGSGNGLRLSYDNGPLSLAAAYSDNDVALNTKWKATNVAGSYNFGVAKVMAVISTDKQTGQSDVKGYLLGATAPVGANGLAKFSYSEGKQDGNKADKIAVGYVHSLSKRTSLYGTYASVKNNGTSAVALGGATGVAGKTSTGFDLGVTHTF